MEKQSNLKKRLYQNLLNQSPKQNHLLDDGKHTKSQILKPKVMHDVMNSTIKKSTSPVFQQGKLLLDKHHQMKSPEVPKKLLTPLPSMKQKLSPLAKSILQQGKLKSKQNLRPHDIFAFYQAFPQMIEDFFYLNRVGHPYDYRIVTYAQRNPLQYMTISSKGVTLYHDKQAQFMSKQQWLQDQKIYFSLQKIQFFKQYKLSKNFIIWKNRMRRHYMKQMSNLLSENLFLSFQYPRRCLKQVRELTNELKETLYFMPPEQIKSMNSDDFLKNVLEHLNKVFIPKIQSIESSISQCLSIAISQQIKKFKLQNNIRINDVGDHDQKDHKQGYVYSQEAILRKEYKKVYKLIKLADNILLQSKIQLIHRCISQLLERIQQFTEEDMGKEGNIKENLLQKQNLQNKQRKQKKEKTEWIICKAYSIDQNQDGYYQNRIRWSPTLQGFKDIFRQIINSTITLINESHEKISSKQKFEKYRTGDEVDNRKDEKRNTIKFMIQESPNYKINVHQIELHLEKQFNRTQKEQIELIKFLNIYNKHKQLPPVKQIFTSHTASEYCQLVREWKKDEEEMKLLPNSRIDGLLEFNFEELKDKIINAPSDTLTQFRSALPKQTYERCTYLLDSSKQLLEEINTYPTDISSFVRFNKSVRTASDKIQELIDQGKQVVQMVTLMEENKLQNVDNYKQRSKQVTNAINSLKSKVDESNAKYDQSLSKFRKELEINTTKVKSKASELISKFEQIEATQFSQIQKSQPMPKILDQLKKLNEIKPEIQEHQRQALQIQQIESELSLPSSNFTQIHNLYKRAKIIHLLWKCQKDWNDLLFEILGKHYNMINCEQVKNKWQDFSNNCNMLQKNIYDNEVLKELTSQINEFENEIETIIALKSSNLQQKSWKQISQYLAYELGTQQGHPLPFSNPLDKKYTVSWLIQNKISLYKQKIIFIVQKSQKQKQLQANLNQFKTFINSLNFSTVTKKREIALIEQNTTLKINLSQKISTLYSLIGNQYSETFKIEAQNLIKHYQYIEQILSALYVFRQQWEKYESFFESTSIFTKLLTKQSKQFTSWELQWKKIIKNVITDPSIFYRKVCEQTTGINCSRSMIKGITKANLLMQMIKKGVEQFLQKKRAQYQRYCLFNDEQLLLILQKVDSKDIINQQIIPLLYDNLQSIQYIKRQNQESYNILSVTTKQSQKILLNKSLTLKSQCQLQDLLKTTEEQIKKIIQTSIKPNFEKYIDDAITRQQLINDNLLQISICVDYISWVRLAEQTYLIAEPIGTLSEWLNIQQGQIREVYTLLNSSTSANQQKFLQFLTHSLYLKQKTRSFIQQQIVSTEQYEWERLPKLMLANNGQVYLKQLDNKISYSSELLIQKQIVILTGETEKVWLNLVNAISNKYVIGVHGQYSQSIHDLAFYLGQSIKEIEISKQCNVKVFERLLTGYIYLNSWLYFKPVENIEVLQYLSYFINNSRKNMIEANNSNFQMTKSTTFTNSSNVGSIFLFESGEKLVQQNLIDTNNFRNVSMIQPNEKKMIHILCEAYNIPIELGTNLVYVIDFCRESFEFKQALTLKYIKNMLKDIKTNLIHRFTKQELMESDLQEYIVLQAVEENLSSNFTSSDLQLFQNFKVSLIPNYLMLRSKFKSRFTKQSPINLNHPVYLYLNSLPNEQQSTYNKQFISEAIKAYNILMNQEKMGLIVSGKILNGKTFLLKFLEDVKKNFENYSNDILASRKFEVYKIYQDFYGQKDIERIESFQQFLKTESLQKWIIFDGYLNNSLSSIANTKFDNLVLSNYGLVNKEKSDKKDLQKIKFIFETLTTKLQPSVFYNYGICHTDSKNLTVQALVKKFFFKPTIKQYLSSLTSQTISSFISQLIPVLSKIEQPNNIKTKQLDFLYPFSDLQITFKILNLIECVFKMNQESIRQKEKNMKKTIQKFIYWAALLTLNLHIDPESQGKLQKKFVEITKCEGIFHENIMNYIVYPGSGIEVHLVNGLRTFSSSFEIPEKGIVTFISRNQINDANNNAQKINKAYDQLYLGDALSVRVNYQQSNSFSYLAQLSAYCNRPVVLYGPNGSGKKSILELYAKNIRNRSQIHSIRYNHNNSLMEMYEKPFRKFNSLSGTVLKSNNFNKNLVVFIQDLSLTKTQTSAIQFLRMIANSSLYLNQKGQTRSLTSEKNSLTILSHRISSDQIVSRLAPRLTFYQTSKITSQKILSIYHPYLKSWAGQSLNQGDVKSIFYNQNAQNTNSLIGSTIKVFEFMRDAFETKKASGNFGIDSILLKPRIGDVSKILAFICQNKDPSNHGLNYYSQIWANQILRVFGDRISPSDKELSTQLLQLIKRESLLTFKQNFHYTDKSSLIFTDIFSRASENENQALSYQKLQDIYYLREFIEIHFEEKRGVSIPQSSLLNELLLEIMKIYRVIEIENGHIIILALNKRIRQFIVEFACKIAQSSLIKLRKQNISLEKDILPIFDPEEYICFFEDLDDITDEQIYQFTCLLNKNYYEFGLRPDIKQKFKEKLIAHYKNQLAVMSDQANKGQKMDKTINLGSSTVSTSFNKKMQNTKQKEAQLIWNQKLEEDFDTIMRQQLMSCSHFVLGGSPLNKKTREFLLNEQDFIGQMHFSFFHLAEESLKQVSRHMIIFDEQELAEDEQQRTSEKNISEEQQQLKKKLKQQKQTDGERVLNKCHIIYNSLPQSEQNFNLLINICDNISHKKVKLLQESNTRIKQLEECISNNEKSKQLVIQHQQKLKESLIKLEELKKQQSELSQQLEQKGSEINQLQLNVDLGQSEDNQQKQQKLLQKNRQFEEIEQQLNQNKGIKQKYDQQIRQSRKIISVAKDFTNIIEEVKILTERLEQEQKYKTNIENILIVWESIVSYIPNQTAQAILNATIQWLKLIEPSSQKSLQSIDQLLNLFERLIVPFSSTSNLELLSSEVKLKILILFFIIKNQLPLTYDHKILSVYDPAEILELLFKNIPLQDSQNGTYSLAFKIDNFNEREFRLLLSKHKRGIILLQNLTPHQEQQALRLMNQVTLLQPSNTKSSFSATNNKFIQNNNHLISLTKNKENSDLSINLQKVNYLNYLKSVSLGQNEQDKLASMRANATEYAKSQRKLKELGKLFREKCAKIQRILNNQKKQIQHYEKKITQNPENQSISFIQTKDQLIVSKLIDELFKYSNHKQLTLSMVKTLYLIIKQKSNVLISEFRESTKLQSQITDLQKGNKQGEQQQAYSQLISDGYKYQQQELIDQLIQKIVYNNFSNSLMKCINDSSLFNLDVLSLELENKIPIVIIPNTLTTYTLAMKENKPTNLLLSQQNLIIENHEEKPHQQNRKFILFYNDEIHHEMLLELVKKYLEEYSITKKQKSSIIYIFTNSNIQNLKLKQKTSQSCQYKLYYYHLFTQEKLQKIKKQFIQNDDKKDEPGQQLMKKVILYLRFLQKVHNKFYNESFLKEVVKFVELSDNEEDNKKYLFDIFASQIVDENQNKIFQSLFNDTISESQMKKFIQDYQKPEELLISQDEQKFTRVASLTQSSLKQLQQQLPNDFKISQFLSNPSKDLFSVQIEKLTQKFNKNLKQIKIIFTQNSKKLKLEMYGKHEQYGYKLPKKEYIMKLNKQKKMLNKVLIAVGLMFGASISMAKIVSSKGLSNNGNQQNLLANNCIFYDQLPLNTKIINLLKIRASKRMKLPYKRVGLGWCVEKKSQNSIYVQKSLIQNAIPEITMSFTSYLQGGSLLLPKDENSNSHKLLKSKLNPNLPAPSNKAFRTFAIPYDLNGSSIAINPDQIASFLHTNVRHSLSKKDTVLSPQMKKQMSLSPGLKKAGSQSPMNRTMNKTMKKDTIMSSTCKKDTFFSATSRKDEIKQKQKNIEMIKMTVNIGSGNEQIHLGEIQLPLVRQYPMKIFIYQCQRQRSSNYICNEQKGNKQMILQIQQNVLNLIQICLYNSNLLIILIQIFILLRSFCKIHLQVFYYKMDS